jgi:hypothetical protein
MIQSARSAPRDDPIRVIRVPWVTEIRVIRVHDDP